MIWMGSVEAVRKQRGALGVIPGWKLGHISTQLGQASAGWGIVRG